MSSSNPALTPEDRSMLNKMFKRSWFLFTGFNMINFQGNGYSMTMHPAIKRFYKDDSEEAKKALTRSAQFFNCTYETAPFIMGLNAAMEKERAQQGDEFEVESIGATKAALMGPLSAIGDSVFWGVVRLLAASIAIPLAANGNLLGPILFLLVFHLPSIATRYYLLRLGYTTGSKFLESVAASGVLKSITFCITIVGMIMVGAMTAQFVTVSTPLNITFGTGETLVLQEIFDNIFKGLLPLVFTFGIFMLVRKKVKILYLAVGSIIVGMILSLIGLL